MVLNKYDLTVGFFDRRKSFKIPCRNSGNWPKYAGCVNAGKMKFLYHASKALLLSASGKLPDMTLSLITETCFWNWGAFHRSCNEMLPKPVWQKPSLGRTTTNAAAIAKHGVERKLIGAAD